MRVHGRAKIDPNYPEARAICDFCGFHYNHKDLRWQYQWQGPKLQNIRFLVCHKCYDIPQEQLRLIILPPDPVAIKNARPENYVNADAPLSAIGASPNFLLQQYGSRIGNLTGGGGINAAFDSNSNKPAWLSANNTISNSSYNNYVGIDWQGNVSNLSMPSSMKPPVVRHSVTNFTATAPFDRSFLGNTATSYVVQGSQVAPAPYGAWTTISSGTTTGVSGETISGNCTGGEYQFHRIAFLGDQINYVAVAQVAFYVAQVGEPVTTGSS